MILINFTGLDRFRWLPRIARQSDGAGLWYVNVQWLNAEATAYSVVMATEMIARFNGMIHRFNALVQPEPTP